LRGEASPKEADEQMPNFDARTASNPESSSSGPAAAAAFAGDSPAFRGLFTSADSQFGKMYARGVFIHWYVNEALETIELDEARSNITDLIQEYEMYETAGVVDVGQGEEDEGDAD
jgi:tubulin beta